MKPLSRKSYTKQNDADGTFALAQVTSSSRGRAGSEDDEIGLARSTDFAKEVDIEGRIHVTRTFQVDS